MNFDGKIRKNEGTSFVLSPLIGSCAPHGIEVASRNPKVTSPVPAVLSHFELHEFMTSIEDNPPEDAFNLSRFLSAQEHTFDLALSELRRGQKKTHWMWFIFPQLDGLGRSPTAKKYAIGNLEEARAYLRHPVLGSRLVDCCRAFLSVPGKAASEILGYPDDLKLKSSMTLFALLDQAQPAFKAVLDKYFDGERDRRTLELLGYSRS